MSPTRKPRFAREKLNSVEMTGTDQREEVEGVGGERRRGDGCRYDEHRAQPADDLVREERERIAGMRERVKQRATAQRADPVAQRHSHASFEFPFRGGLHSIVGQGTRAVPNEITLSYDVERYDAVLASPGFHRLQQIHAYRHA